MILSRPAKVEDKVGNYNYNYMLYMLHFMWFWEMVLCPLAKTKQNEKKQICVVCPLSNLISQLTEI